MNSSDIVYPSGSDLIDLVVGGGQRFGYPAGKIVNLVGDKSSGKTFLACEIVAAAYHLYGKKLQWLYDDAESGFTFDTKSMYGMEIIPADEDDRHKSRTVEEFEGNYYSFIERVNKAKAFGIYILDSLDGLSSKENQQRAKDRVAAFKSGKKIEKGSYAMEAAKFLSQDFFKNITDVTEQNNVLLIIISQTRDKIGSLFPEQTRAGGKALDFYAHTALWLATTAKIVRRERQVGVVVRARTKKSKTPRPFRECLFTLLFDYGLDNTGSNLDYLFDLRGDDGKITAAAKNVIWGAEGTQEVTVKTLSEFIKANGKEADFKAAKKRDGLSSGKIAIQDWILAQAELKEAFDKTFGLGKTRDEMIAWVEENGKEAELTERVRAKWEAIEEDIRSKRKRKYA